jgi:hypothetical protein
MLAKRGVGSFMSGIPEFANKPGQRHDVLSRFSNPWIGLLTAIFSIVAVPLAIYLYFAGARTRRLTYFVSPVKTIVVKGGEASTLRVLHGDQEIKGDVTAAQVAIWNEGTESIRSENVLSPVRIVLRPPVPILEAKIRKVSRGVTGIGVDASSLSEGVLPVAWKILEHSDGAVIQLIFAGSTETDVAVEGTLEGQPTVFRAKPRDKILSPTEQVAHARAFAVAYAALLLVMTVIFFSFRWLRWRRGDELDLFERIIPWGFAVLLCIGLLLA